ARTTCQSPHRIPGRGVLRVGARLPGGLTPRSGQDQGGHMHSLLARRPSPAMVVASIALIVALGGTSVAAVSALAPNSVGPVQLKAGAVTNPKLRNNSLTPIDFAAGALPRGPAGPAGPAGPGGPAGPAGTVGPITVRQDSVS